MFISEPIKQACSICGVELSEDEVYILHDRVLCEDCHMEETHPVKVCNPLPVMTAKNMGTTKKDPKEVLDKLQKSIYKFVKDNKKESRNFRTRSRPSKSKNMTNWNSIHSAN